MKFPLTEWALTIRDQQVPTTSNFILNTLCNYWKKNHVTWIPSTSPLASFIKHPSFQAVAEMSNFRRWEERGLTQFYMLGVGRQVYSQADILNIIGDTVKNGFQYNNQVQTFINRIQRRENLLRP